VSRTERPQGLVENLVAALRDWCDEALQRRTWLAADGPEISSFIELVCQTFDDTNLEACIEADLRPAELTDEAFAALKELSRAVMEVDAGRAPAELLADPQVAEIRALAGAALKRIDAR
jgi:hypothetical protein